ncbi:MAG: hypothetical protein HYR48_03775 [Gemmatimonadetes bacterium]|nr:hypothetical protein [Gemmatimonadota bacterium]
MVGAGGTKLAGCAALIACAVAAGCATDSADKSGSVAGPPSGIAEGTRVSGTRSETVEIVGRDGAPIERPMPIAPFEARVRRGVAVAQGAGVIVATTRALRGRRALSFTDRQGHRAEVVATGGDGRGPIASLRLYQDGQIVSEVSTEWESRPGGWLLKDRTLTLYRNGQVLLRHRRSAAAVEMAHARGGSRILDLGAARVARALAPTELRAQLTGCITEAIAYAGALYDFVAAASQVTLWPSDPEAWTTLRDAASAMEWAELALCLCFSENLE